MVVTQEFESENVVIFVKAREKQTFRYAVAQKICHLSTAPEKSIQRYCTN